MILFKQEHVNPILRGRKTQTRRTGKKRWNIGAIHQARTNMPWQGDEGHFADIKILDVRKEKLKDLSVQDLCAEGYDTYDQFWDIWKEINGELNLEEEINVVEFEVVKNLKER
ncbi:MAG: ASCH domain-containing protein [Halanaerobiales bacterium]|nr:ASCH domain-containing protein [Halanaerobiales bacterium]